MSNPNVDITLEYHVPPLGTVAVTLTAYDALLSNLKAMRYQPALADTYPRYLLAGITRNAYEQGTQPPLFDNDFIEHGYGRLDLPLTLEQKSQHLLKHLYEKAEPILLRASHDYALTYTDGPGFEKVVNALDDEFLISFRKSEAMGGTGYWFHDVRLTELGREAVEATHP
jgi:hypothetical protein